MARFRPNPTADNLLAAIDRSRLSDGTDPIHLDAALIRLGGDSGRPITQAVSRAVYEWYRDVDGIAYESRIDSTQRCWAVYGHVPVHVVVTNLAPQDPGQRQAVQDAAGLLKFPLPSTWR